LPRKPRIRGSGSGARKIPEGARFAVAVLVTAQGNRLVWQGRYHRPVRRLVKLALIALGIRALWRWRQRRQAEDAALAPAPAGADPADELRRKLAESREEEPLAETSSVPEATVEGRRSQVHEQGRATLDEMTSSDEG
jgi:hypothetical protein